MTHGYLSHSRATASRRLLRGGILRVAAYAAMGALSVLSTAVLTRYLGVVDFGLYTTVLSLTTATADITDAGMATIGTREYATVSSPRRELLMEDLLTLRVLLTLVGALLTLAFALIAGYRPALVLGALLASLATVPLVVQHTFSIPLLSDLRLGVTSALDLTRHALWVLCRVALAAAGAGVLPLLAVTLATNAVFIPPTARLVRGRINVKPSVRPGAWPPLLRDTLAYSAAAVVGTLYVYSTQVITSLVAPAHQTGLYAVSFRVFVVVAQIPSLAVAAALPVLATAAQDDLGRLIAALRRILQLTLVIGTGLALTISAGAGFIVGVVAGNRYQASGDVLALQALALIPSCLIPVWSFALLSLRRHRALLYANLSALLISGVITVLLARSHGASGAAVATVCGEGALAAAGLIALAARDRRFLPDLRLLVKVAAAAAVAVVCSRVPELPSVVAALVALVSFTAAAGALRVLPKDLLHLLP